MSRRKAVQHRKTWHALERALGDPVATARELNRLPARLAELGRAMEALDDGRVSVVQEAAARARSRGHLDVALVLEAALCDPDTHDPTRARAAAKRQDAHKKTTFPFLDLYRSYLVALAGLQKARPAALTRAAGEPGRGVLEVASRALTASANGRIYSGGLGENWPRAWSLARHAFVQRPVLDGVDRYGARLVRPSTGVKPDNPRWRDLFGGSKLEMRYREGRLLPLSMAELKSIVALPEEEAKVWVVRLLHMLRQKTEAGEWAALSELVPDLQYLFGRLPWLDGLDDAHERSFDKLHLLSTRTPQFDGALAWLWWLHHENWTPEERLVVGRASLGAAPSNEGAPSRAMAGPIRDVLVLTRRLAEVEQAVLEHELLEEPLTSAALRVAGVTAERLKLIQAFHFLSRGKPRSAIRASAGLVSQVGPIAAAEVLSQGCMSLAFADVLDGKGLKTARVALEALLESLEGGGLSQDAYTWEDISPTQARIGVLRGACFGWRFTARQQEVLADRILGVARRHGDPAEELGVAAVVGTPKQQKHALRQVARSIGKQPAADRAHQSWLVFARALDIAAPVRSGTPELEALSPLARGFLRLPAQTWSGWVSAHTNHLTRTQLYRWIAWALHVWPEQGTAPAFQTWLATALGVVDLAGARGEDVEEAVGELVEFIDTARPDCPQDVVEYCESHLGLGDDEDELEAMISVMNDLFGGSF